METIGQRIRKLRKSVIPPMNQPQLAARLGVKTSAVTQWELDKTKPSGENLLSLARELQTSPEEILGIKQKQLAVNEIMGGYKNHRYLGNMILPLFLAEELTIAGGIPAKPRSERWQATTAKVGDRAFALVAHGRSNQNPYGTPSIADGAIVIVDPEIPPIQGKIVVALPGENSMVTIKRFTIDGADEYLEPLNPDYKPMKIEPGFKILGVVVQIIQDL